MARARGKNANQRRKAAVGNKPAGPRATRPRIMVTDGNGAVERQVMSCGGIVVDDCWDIELSIIALASCDGLVINGGGDVNPELYNAKRHQKTQPISATRDYRELSLLGAARALGIPVLGICRGMQVIAVEAGGTLYQHVPDRVGHFEHDCSMMPVRTVRGSLVNRALGNEPDMLHLHHQAVRQVPAGFQVTASHADGTIEAIESIDGRVIAVQFHPESVLGLGKGHNGWQLFDAFVKSCNRYRRRAEYKGRLTLPDPYRFMDAWPVAQREYRDRFYTGWANTANTVSKPASKPYQPKNTPHQLRGGALVPTEGTGGVGLAPAFKSAAESAEVLAVLLDMDATMEEGPECVVAFCPYEGIAFDDWSDFRDHMSYFHPLDKQFD